MLVERDARAGSEVGPAMDDVRRDEQDEFARVGLGGLVGGDGLKAG